MHGTYILFSIMTQHHVCFLVLQQNIRPEALGILYNNSQTAFLVTMQYFFTFNKYSSFLLFTMSIIILHLFALNFICHLLLQVFKISNSQCLYALFLIIYWVYKFSFICKIVKKKKMNLDFSIVTSITCSIKRQDLHTIPVVPLL